ncbi:MAG: L-glutamate gamma-semialdehyde dehydrogenase [Pseudomonadota bacterium]
MPDTLHSHSINWDRLDQWKFADEEAYFDRILKAAPLNPEMRRAAVRRGRDLVEIARAKGRKKGMMESFLEEFGLSNAEGLALMCLAEALLRVPDAETRDDLIAEKIRSGDWHAHKGQSDSWLVNASTWGLMLTGRVIGPPRAALKGAAGFIQGLVRESGEPVIRASMMQAMRIMGEQFVLGRTVEEALKRGKRMVKAGEAAHFSFDMLGEGARTADDAARYTQAYAEALSTVAKVENPGTAPEHKSGLSVKLSALHPRYDALNEARVIAELYPRLLTLCEQACAANLNLCLDAEEADRLILSLKLLERLVNEPALRGWTGLGLAVQAYQKRASEALKHIHTLAKISGQRLMVRLVKGAYWDTEIKHAQEAGHPNFPVFTTKAGTDLNYLQCARQLLEAAPDLYLQFATHNAHTLAAIELMARERGMGDGWEVQRLHGMGEALYDAAEQGHRVRIYAPVGAHKDLLPYLVRRLLENGANTSFVHRFLDPDVPVETVVEDPAAILERGPRRHPKIPTPPRLYGAERVNAAGLDLTQSAERTRLLRAINALPQTISSKPIADANADTINDALDRAVAAQPAWDACGGERAKHLRAMGDALEADMVHLIALLADEAGKTLGDGIAEVREAIDFCRYYAAQCERHFSSPQRLPGPAGETNHLSLHGRGVFACISPWNFPLAIFTGQIAAALAAGNTVVAKPAEQTPRIAAEAVELFFKAGLPEDVLHLLPGTGEHVGAALCKDERIAGVCFTGGTDTARVINRTLADRPGPIIPLIAETGGLNAMFVDTTALREQVIDDILTSAFGSAGQRCSALRLVFVPHDTADSLITGLIGAMDELKLGDPSNPQTDVGPVIDKAAKAHLSRHLDRMAHEAKVLKQLKVPDDIAGGTFFGPALLELDHLDQIETEVFGPILHLLRYDPDDVATVAKALKAKGYGLTLGIHSRLQRFAETVKKACPVGNTYVNRSMTGAVVGVQPFGGEGLSGTGPKAGGPHYLQRFATERTVTVNIAAQGGDPELLSL